MGHYMRFCIQILIGVKELAFTGGKGHLIPGNQLDRATAFELSGGTDLGHWLIILRWLFMYVQQMAVDLLFDLSSRWRPGCKSIYPHHPHEALNTAKKDGSK